MIVVICVYAPSMYRQTKLEPVRLTVTTRTGNKKATLVDNLDYYGISPTDVVHQVQRIAAASATGTYMYVYHDRWAFCMHASPPVIRTDQIFWVYGCLSEL